MGFQVGSLAPETVLKAEVFLKHGTNNLPSSECAVAPRPEGARLWVKHLWTSGPLQPHGPPSASASAAPGHPQWFICSTLPPSLPVHLTGQSAARTTAKAACQAPEPQLV